MDMSLEALSRAVEQVMGNQKRRLIGLSGDEEAGKIFDFFRSYNKDSQKLVEALSSVGITPTVVLPTAVWRVVMDKMELFSMVLSQSRTVDIFPTVCERAMEEAQSRLRGPHWKWGIIPLLLGVVLSLIFGRTEGVMVVSLVVVVVGLGIALRFYYDRRDEAKELTADILREKFREAEKAGRVHDLLWPGREIYPLEGEKSIQVNLPEPGRQARNVLYKARMLDLISYTAVTREAMHLVGDPLDVILSSDVNNPVSPPVRALVEAEVEPILYVYGGDAVAILAEYGRFAIPEDIFFLALKECTPKEMRASTPTHHLSLVR